MHKAKSVQFGKLAYSLNKKLKFNILFRAYVVILFFMGTVAQKGAIVLMS